MLRQMRQRIEAEAAAYLLLLGCHKGEFEISISCGELRHTLLIHQWPDDPPPPCEGCSGSAGPRITSVRRVPLMPAVPDGFPAGAQWLSPLEAKIMDALSAGGWMASDRIAEKIGERFGDGFKAILTNLADRGLLESRPGAGYRLVQLN